LVADRTAGTAAAAVAQIRNSIGILIAASLSHPILGEGPDRVNGPGRGRVEMLPSF
jgi:hypothetical protein